MSMVKSSKLLKLINYRLRVTIKDGRQLVGTLLAFDRHMNLVLGDCEEQRKTRQKIAGSTKALDQTLKRMLGLILLRGENVVCMQVDSPPRGRVAKLPDKPGPGTARPAGRGAGVGAVGPGAPSGFASNAMGMPAPGLGAPMPSAMMPMGGAGRGVPSTAAAQASSAQAGQPVGAMAGAAGQALGAAALAPGAPAGNGSAASSAMQSGVS